MNSQLDNEINSKYLIEKKKINKNENENHSTTNETHESIYEN
jgi:hypothetical protein